MAKTQNNAKENLKLLDKILNMKMKRIPNKLQILKILSRECIYFSLSRG